jgi:uncharacterized damage-inducible protein DinB
MNSKSQLLAFARYNHWANSLLVNWLLTKDASLMNTELKSSFNTINQTLSHIWFGEYIWMQRILGEEFENIRQHIKSEDIVFISKELLNNSTRYISFLQTIEEINLTNGITYYQATIEKDETTSIGDIIHHILNHSTYHRGQLVTMGRTLGFQDPPKSDYIQFLREK